MADYDLGTARGRIEVDASGAEFGIGRAASAVDDLDRRQAAASGNMLRTGAVMIGGAAAIGAGFGVAINAAADFEQGISAIAAVSGATGTELDRIREKALQLGADTSFSAGEAALAMEELVKAGLSVDEVLNGAADATVALAAAGGVDLPTAATIASNAMNQFNLSAEDMVGVADTIAGAANASAIDVGQFGLSLSQVGAVANTAGVSFEDTATAIAMLGNAGIVGSDAGTSLKAMFMNLQPTTERQIELFNELGLMSESAVTSMNPMGNAFFDAAGAMRPMEEVVGLLGSSLEGMSEAQRLATLETIFGSDAVRAAAVLADQGAEGFRNMADAMGETSAADVAAVRLDNFSGSMEALKGSIETLLIRFGTPMLNALRNFVEMITEAVNWVSGLDEGTLSLIRTVGQIAMVVLGAVGGFLLAAGAVNQVKTAFEAMKLAMIGHPFLLIAAAVAALGYALYRLYQDNETFRNAVQVAWGWIRDNVGPIIQNLILGFQVLVEWIQTSLVPALMAAYAWFNDNVLPVLIAIGQAVGFLAVEIAERLVAAFLWLQENVFPVVIALGELIAAVVERIVTVVAWLAPAFQAMWDAVQIILDGLLAAIGLFVDTVQTIWQLFGDNILDIATIIWDAIRAVVELALGVIQGIIETVTGIISGDWSQVWEGIKDIFSSVWDFMEDYVGISIDAIKLIIETVMDIIHGAWDISWNAVSTILTTIWDTMKGTVETVFNLIKGIIENTLGTISGIWSTVWNTIKGVVTTIWDTIKSSISTAINEVKTTIETVMNTVKGIWETIWGQMRDFVNGLWGGITSTFRGAVNGILRALGGAINGVIDVINAAIDALDSSLGPFINFGEIPHVPIPQIETGGAILHDTVAALHQGEGVVNRAGMDSLYDFLNDVVPMLERAFDTAGASALVGAGVPSGGGATSIGSLVDKFEQTIEGVPPEMVSRETYLALRQIATEWEFN